MASKNLDVYELHPRSPSPPVVRKRRRFEELPPLSLSPLAPVPPLLPTSPMHSSSVITLRRRSGAAKQLPLLPLPLVPSPLPPPMPHVQNSGMSSLHMQSKAGQQFGFCSFPRAYFLLVVALSVFSGDLALERLSDERYMLRPVPKSAVKRAAVAAEARRLSSVAASAVPAAPVYVEVNLAGPDSSVLMPGALAVLAICPQLFVWSFFVLFEVWATQQMF